MVDDKIEGLIDNVVVNDSELVKKVDDKIEVLIDSIVVNEFVNIVEGRVEESNNDRDVNKSELVDDKIEESNDIIDVKELFGNVFTEISDVKIGVVNE